MISINKNIQLVLGLFSVGLLAACANTTDGSVSTESTQASTVSPFNENASPIL